MNSRCHGLLILISAIILCWLDAAALAQQSGTFYKELATFRAVDTGGLTFDVTDKQAGEKSLLAFEFGRDGVGATPDPVLSDSVKFNVSVTVNNVTTTFPPFPAQTGGEVTTGNKT